MNTKTSLSFLTVFSFMLLCSFTPAGHNKVGPASSKAAFVSFSCAGPTNLRSYPALGYSGVKWKMPYTANYEFVCYYSGDDPGSCQYVVASDAQTSSIGVASVETDLPGYYDWQVRIGCPDDGMSEWSYASFYVPAE